MIRIFIIDDHPLISDGVHDFIHPFRDGIKLVGEALNVTEAIPRITEKDPDIILLDLYIPGSEPVENIRILKIKFPGKKIVIYTGGTSSVYSGIMADEGASGYLTKDLDR